MPQDMITIEPWQIREALDRGSRARSRAFIDAVRWCLRMLTPGFDKPAPVGRHVACPG